MPQEPDKTVSEATGEFIPGKDDQPELPPTQNMATGEYLPEGTADRGPSAGTRLPRVQPGDATGEFHPAADGDGEGTGGGVGDATGAYMPGEGEGSVRFLTGKQPMGHLTTPASAGAFPAPDPQQRTGRYFLKKFHAKGGMGEVWM